MRSRKVFSRMTIACGGGCSSYFYLVSSLAADTQIMTLYTFLSQTPHLHAAHRSAASSCASRLGCQHSLVPGFIVLASATPRSCHLQQTPTKDLRLQTIAHLVCHSLAPPRQVRTMAFFALKRCATAARLHFTVGILHMHPFSMTALTPTSQRVHTVLWDNSAVL